MSDTGAKAARWEAGSEFDWHDSVVGDPPSPHLPGSYALFSTGRAAILALARMLGASGGGRMLHLPSYFCGEVAACLGSELALDRYRDLPSEPAPDFRTLRPARGDLVLAVNFFGVRDGAPWREWGRRHDGIILIEDHTHDPSSPWAWHSTAPYAMASLRKTLPLPDGAIVWSPQGLPLPKPTSEAPAGSLDKLAAMVLKGAYLRGAAISKDAFRTLQLRGERGLGMERDSTASEFTRCLLESLDIDGMQRRRCTNVQRFLSLAAQVELPWAAPLFRTWPQGATPYNPVIICEDQARRNAVRSALAARNVYCAVHWPLRDDSPHGGDLGAYELSQRVLTIPADHRYSCDDIDMIISILRSVQHEAG